MKKKLKRFGIFLLFAIPLLYFLFTLLFFSPFEEPFGKIEKVIPREVDLFLSKAGLMDDFDDFPVPNLYRKLEVNREWRAFTKTELFQELTAEINFETLVDEIRDGLVQIPIDPLEDVIGREVAVAGNFKREVKENELPISYLVFFRGSWKAKLGYELANWDMIRGFAGDPLIKDSTSVTHPEGYATMVLGDGREFYMKRASDLIIFGDDEDLIREVCSLIDQDEAGIDQSLGGSMAWENTIDSLDRLDSGYMDFHGNMDHLFQQVDFDEAWKENKTDFTAMTAMTVFNPDFFKTITGVLRFGAYLDMSASLEFNPEMVSKAETGFFGLDSVSIKESLDFLVSQLPPDVFFAGCARIDLEPFLKIVERTLNPELKKLITDFIREGRRYNRRWDVTGLWDFIEKLDATFGELVYLALRPRDLDKALIPEVQPLPIVAVVLEIKNMENYLNIEKTVVEMQNNNYQSFEMWQFKNEIHGCRIKGINTSGMDDIEQIAYTCLDDRYFILATSSAFIQDMLKARSRPRDSLKQATKYRPASEFFAGHGNLACYLDAQGLKGELSNYSVYWAEINSRIYWDIERPKAEARIVQRDYPQYRGRKELPPQVKEAVERKVDAELDQMEKERLDFIVPEMTENFRKYLEWIDLVESVSFMVNVNLNDVDLGLRMASIFSKKKSTP